MYRTLELLGSALVAAIVLFATVASPAQGEIFALSSEVEKTTLRGEQEGLTKIGVDGGTVSCEVAKFAGEMSGEYAFETAFTPTYEKCNMGEGSSAEVKMNGCKLVFTTGTKEGSNYELEARIRCESGKSISIVKTVLGVTKCTVDIGPQAGLSKATATEAGSPSAIKTSIALSGIKYSQTAGTGLGACATAENTSNGTYEGTETIKGFVGETQQPMKDEALPKTIEISKNPVQFNGMNTTATFDITNISGESLTITNFVIDGTLMHMAKCVNKTLAKKGDKCTEEMKCVAPGGEEPWIGVIVGPPGGARTKAKGC